nr:MAG TPA: hypothetical protein [Caudoviricetes sp.]
MANNKEIHIKSCVASLVKCGLTANYTLTLSLLRLKSRLNMRQ